MSDLEAPTTRKKVSDGALILSEKRGHQNP